VVPVTLTARQRARAQVTEEIVEEARRQLAAEGAVGLSLRAIARELGMPSSGIYRYFATRDELLTRLILDAYNALGEAVEESGRGSGDVGQRFAACCRTVRQWALDHPHEYALIFGSPVPGYRAPEETALAALRIPAALAALLAESDPAGPAATGPASTGPASTGPSASGPPASPPDELSAAATAGIAPALVFLEGAVTPSRVQAGLMIWTGLFGEVSFELFGHLEGSVADEPDDRAAFFEECIRRWAAQAGIASGPPGPSSG
jgi:AcrR family transcriptional regulator